MEQEETIEKRAMFGAEVTGQLIYMQDRPSLKDCG
jgi:hypothetical protein